VFELQQSPAGFMEGLDLFGEHESYFASSVLGGTIASIEPEVLERPRSFVI
jgi:hypothetical protein